MLPYQPVLVFRMTGTLMSIGHISSPAAKEFRKYFLNLFFFLFRPDPATGEHKKVTITEKNKPGP